MTSDHQRARRLVWIGGSLQVASILFGCLLLYIIFFVPIPTDSDPFTQATFYDRLVTRIHPYAGLLLVGVFFVGRWMVKKGKRQQTESSSQ